MVRAYPRSSTASSSPARKLRNANQWHAERRRTLLQLHPEIRPMMRAKDSQTLCSLLLSPVLHLTIAVLCGAYRLHLAMILLLAGLIGAPALFQMFNNGHELCHELIHDRVKARRTKNWLLHYILLPDVNPLQFMYFASGHISHHIHLGAQSEHRAARLDLAQDADVLSHLGYLLGMRRASDRPASLWFASVRHPLLRYLAIGCVMPLLDTLSVFAFAVPVAAYRLAQLRNSPLVQRKLLPFLRHCFMLYALLATLWLCVGPRSVLYLLATRLFFVGWLGHPLLAYWLTVHQSQRDGGSVVCQPTSSIYDPLLAWLTSNETYHVEHHDFPTVPARLLPQLHALARDSYSSLPHHNSWLRVVRDYFVNRDDWIYACQ